MDGLKKSGIDINEVLRKLLDDGVTAFKESFDSLLNHLEEKASTVKS